jgi:hypothetical protein
MKKFMVFLFITMFLVSQSPSIKSSAVTLGKPCKKIGRVVEQWYVVYKCVKSGKKAIWQKVGVWTEPTSSPTVSPSPQPSPTQSSPSPTSPAGGKNPVVERIDALIAALPPATQRVAPKVEWVASDEISKSRIDDLKSQHQRLSDAYPELYVWEDTALALISSDPKWILAKVQEAGCTSEGTLRAIQIYAADPARFGAAQTFCRNERPVTFFLDRNFPPLNWAHVMGSEFGTLIQQKEVLKSPLASAGKKWEWDTFSPEWYREGGQTIFSAMGSSRQEGRWSFNSRDWILEAGDWCINDDLIEYRCSNKIGAISIELAIAIYGLDAPLKMWGNLEAGLDQRALFERSFNSSFDKFNEWTKAYRQFLVARTPLPEDLLQALQKK